MKKLLLSVLLLLCASTVYGQTVTMPKDQSAKIGELVTLVVKFSDCESFEWKVSPKEHARAEKVYTDDKSVVVIQIKPSKHGVYFLRVTGLKGTNKVSDVCEIDVGTKADEKPDLPPIKDVPDGKKMLNECGKGYIPLTAEKRRLYHAQSQAKHGEKLKRLAKFQELPPAFDCRDKGWILPVGDQGGCVLPGSTIRMANGKMKVVEDVIVGDVVLDADGRPARVNWCTSRTVDEELVGIVVPSNETRADVLGAMLQSGTINVSIDANTTLWLTPDHPVFVGKSLIPAGVLTVDDSVLMRNEQGENLSKIIALKRKRYSGKVHNLIISRSETYIVNGICVHNCGSCYLYSTIYGTASQAFVKNGWGKPDGSFVLAVQFGMDRPRNFGGCGGGNGTEVIDWMVNHGWPCESYVDLQGNVHLDYPTYQARSGTDRTKPGAKLWKPASWGFVATGNRTATVQEIKTGLYNYGGLNVSLDAGGQFGNGSSTITRLGGNIDHEIELIAWDDAHDNGDGTVGAFLLKNQWTKSWGNGGVRWLSYKASQGLVDVFFVQVTSNVPPTIVPVITGPTSASCIVGKPFSVQIVAQNSPTGYGASNLPNGLTIDTGTGLISGTATLAGTATVGLTATNSAGVASANMTLTVTDSSDKPPVITSPLKAFGVIGEQFEYQIKGTNNPTVFFAIGLPAGLACDAKGLITGVPTSTSITKVILLIANGVGRDDKELVITVTATPAVLGTGVLSNGQKFKLVPDGQTIEPPKAAPINIQQTTPDAKQKNDAEYDKALEQLKKLQDELDKMKTPKESRKPTPGPAVKGGAGIATAKKDHGWFWYTNIPEYYTAREQGKWLVVLVGNVYETSVPSSIVVRVPEAQRSSTPRIIVWNPVANKGRYFPPSTSSSDLIQYASSVP